MRTDTFRVLLVTMFATLMSLAGVPDVAAVCDCRPPIFGGCRTNYRCEGDVCVTDPRDCSTGDICNPGHCEESVGCVVDHLCADDGLVCNGISYCQPVFLPFPPYAIPVCTSTPAIDCDDHDVCTIDSPCTEGTLCTHDLRVCDDGDPCTSDFCVSPALGCTGFRIDGCCHGTPDCTAGDQCRAQACVGNRCEDVGPRDCDDVDPCTADSCDPEAGCVHTPITGCGTSPQPPECRSNADCVSACATGRTCRAGSCSAGTPTVCDDGDPCTIDSCDPAAGCVPAARTGFDFLACVCERAGPPECTDQSVPKSVTKRLTAGCSAVSRAASATGRKRTTLINKAAKQFQAASKKAKKIGGHKGVNVDCGNALASRFTDDQSRAITVRGQP